MTKTHSTIIGPGIVAGKPVIQVDGKECHVVALEHPLVTRLAGLLLIRKDIEFVRSAFEKLKASSQSEENLVKNQSLWFAGVIAYAKCFVSADGRKIKLEKKDHFRGAPSEIVAGHDALIDLRNQYIAHSGNSLNENATIWVALYSHKKGVAGVFETVSHAFSIVPDELDSYIGTVIGGGSFSLKAVAINEETDHPIVKQLRF